MCVVWLLLTFVPHRWSRQGWRPPVSVTEFQARVPCKHAGGSWHPSTKSASSSNSATRLRSKWPAPTTRRPGRGKSRRPDPKGSSPLQAPGRTSFPARLISFTSRTRRVFAGRASIRQAPWPANATRTRTARPSAAAGATTLRAGWWRDRVSARCAGAAMSNANSAHKEKRFTPVRSKTRHDRAEHLSPVWEQWISSGRQEERRSDKSSWFGERSQRHQASWKHFFERFCRAFFSTWSSVKAV